MEDELNEVRCGKPDCQVAQTGSCAEGHSPLASCPNFGKAVEEDFDDYDDDQPDDADGGAATEVWVPLPSGEALGPEAVERFLLWRPATFVTVVGESYSGKTTLVCALYDRFLRGSFTGLSFVGSRTLVALERRSHYSRVESGRIRPETARTSISEGLSFYHFAVAAVGRPASRVDLLISDRAGEMYRYARDDSTIVANLSEIPRADRLVLLLDGGRVTDAVERADAMQSARQTLRVFLDNGALGKNSNVQVVTTKIDLIARAADQAQLTEALRLFKERLRADFGPRLRTLTFWEIAARDPTGTLNPAHGLDALIADWVTPCAGPVCRVSSSTQLRSEFDRLLVRTPLEDDQ